MSRVLAFFLIFLISQNLFPQAEISISTPRLDLSDNILRIDYDILFSSQSDTFNVWIEVIDSKGNKINAVSLSGDFGKEVNGGTDKQIIWDLGRDNIMINEEIAVEIFAEKIITHDLSPGIETVEKPPPSDKNISRGNMVASSLILPGWGQSKNRNGSPYWLMGVAAYGCLTGSVLFHNLSSSSYDDYLEALNIQDRNNLYDNAVQQDKLSKYLGISAVGIWAVNMIWIIATPSQPDKSFVRLKGNQIELIPRLDLYSKSSMISLTYRF